MSGNGLGVLLQSMPNNLRQLWYLVWELSRREAFGRYKGSALGFGWIVLSPIIMLLIYTFVFSMIFQVRWGSEGGSRAEFALNLYAGLLIHAMLGDCLTRAPGLIKNNINFVKKIVFPLWILPLVNIISSLMHSLIGMLILIMTNFVVGGELHLTVLLLPVVLLPFLVLVAGVGWALASTGVYLRDLNQLMPVVSVGALFLAPIFYPISMLPEHLQGWMYLNPLTLIVEQLRGILFHNNLPDISLLGMYMLIAMMVAGIGIWLFGRLQKGFADVV